MRAEELRIGNLVMDNAKVKIVTSGMISNWDIIKKDYGGYKPIPLTEEWLLRFGFGMMNKSYFSIPSRTRTNNSPYSLIYTKDLNGDWYILINESVRFYLEHVHTLQNLYFALTQEELTLNETR
jgi:hypothetical protein